MLSGIIYVEPSAKRSLEFSERWSTVIAKAVNVPAEKA
jgi:hypothetical protein